MKASEATGVVLIVIVVLAVVVGGSVRLTLWSTSKSCLAAYDQYQPQWSVWGGCRVMWDGKLTPTDIIREIN